MEKFEVSIDIGDIISCQLRQFYSEAGQYARQVSDAKHYMYDFFLQINLASANLGAEQGWDMIEHSKEMSYLQQDILKSSAILGENLSTLDDFEQIEIDQQKVKAQLEQAERQRFKHAMPTSTVFFRFSHRDKNKQVLSITS